jgi:hypothetical protein
VESENVLAMRHFVGLKLTVLPITGHDGQDPVRAMKSPYRWPASLESPQSTCLERPESIHCLGGTLGKSRGSPSDTDADADADVCKGPTLAGVSIADSRVASAAIGVDVS